MKVNRFLALCGNAEGDMLEDSLVWAEHMEVHDSYLLKCNAPGTVRAALMTVRAILKWCGNKGHAPAGAMEEVRLDIGLI
ncbi:hypothetical protein DPMN_009069 [Dreissena polymorpha]|uniref:Uncharacterized protein n=1 Tax=Dreissena polymorpha TaxID=45954 RepID=A0A9D4MXD7_DREPO|nr:hypothetical protein DPMN_009069 [Dreissena polymorpha]